MAQRIRSLTREQIYLIVIVALVVATRLLAIAQTDPTSANNSSSTAVILV